MSDPRSSQPFLPAEAPPSLPGILLRAEPLARSPRAALYRGWDLPHCRRVLVKALRAGDDPSAARRFGREAAVLVRLRHPSIVRLYAFYPSGPSGADPAKSNPAALVMEYVSGVTLDALVKADGRLSPARTVQIVEEVAAALDCVHALGVVHRDIKPASVLLPHPSIFRPWRGPAKLTDFGVAHLDDDLPLTVMGDILGAIEYASPEQVHGGGSAADARSDVYSLAAVTYFALTGTPPFRAADASTQSQLSVMHRQMFSDPPPLRFHRGDLSPAVEEAVLRGLEKAPEARYASAGQLAAALRAALAASEGEPQQKAIQASARRTGVMAGAAAGAVLLAGFIGWAAKHQPKPPIAVSAAGNKIVPSSLRPRMTEQGTPPATSAPHAAPKRIAVKTAPVKTAPVKMAPPRTAPLRPTKEAVAVAPVPKPRAPRVVPAKMTASEPVRHAAVPKPPRLAPSLAKSAKAAKTAAPPVRPVSVIPAAETGAGWYAVSGWIALPGPKTQLVQASPAWVQVDGHPLPELASGGWTVLPAGTHRVTFQPAAGLGVGPKTWTVKIAPSAHIRQQIPLPPAPLPEIPTHLRDP